MERRLSSWLLLGCLTLISFGSFGPLALFTAAPAAAQDQSERIDQLEQLIARQQAQLDALQAQISQLLAQREDAAPLAPARRVTSSSDTVALSIYGQVNRGVLYANDGHT